MPISLKSVDFLLVFLFPFPFFLFSSFVPCFCIVTLPADSLLLFFCSLPSMEPAPQAPQFALLCKLRGVVFSLPSCRLSLFASRCAVPVCKCRLVSAAIGLDRGIDAPCNPPPPLTGTADFWTSQRPCTGSAMQEDMRGFRRNKEREKGKDVQAAAVVCA